MQLWTQWNTAFVVRQALGLGFCDIKDYLLGHSPKDIRIELELLLIVP
jgi:hypothetical protein